MFVRPSFARPRVALRYGQEETAMRLSVTTLRTIGLTTAVPLFVATVLTATPRAAADETHQPPPGQPPLVVPAHAPSEALDMGPLTLSSSLSYFAGQTVRLRGVRVDQILSPRLIIVEPDNMPPSQNYYGMDSRALVVLAGPTSTPLQRGSSIEIVGQPWTLAEAGLKGDQDVLSELGKKRTRRYQHKPVIHATLVRTPGGIELSGH
jgi:hypothetical protein